MSYERQPIADHAINLASTIQLNLKRSLEALGVVSTSGLCCSALNYPAKPVSVGLPMWV